MSEQTSTGTPANVTATAGNEGGDTFVFHDPRIDKDIHLPTKFGDHEAKPLIEGIIQESKRRARKEFRDEIAKLQAKASEADQWRDKYEELENSTLPTKDREAKEYQKNMQKLTQELEVHRNKSAQYESILKAEKLSNALMREAAKFPDIIDIEQTTTLFQAQCSPTLVIDGENVKLSAKLNGEETELSDAFSKWLSSERNANLLKNKLHSGGGSSGGQRAAPAKTISRAQFNAMSPADKMAFMTNGGGLTD